MPAKVDLSEDDVPLIVRALEHYHAYLVATQREDDRYMQLAERLKRKEPASEQAASASKKKQA